MAADTITEDLNQGGGAPKRARKKREDSAQAKPDTARKRASGSPKNAPATKREQAAPALSARAATLPRELGGLALIALAIAIALAVLSFEITDLQPGASAQNLIGPVGARLADALLTLFGVGALCFDAMLWYLGFMLLLNRPMDWRAVEVAGQLVFILAGTILAHLMLGERLFLGHAPGGALGALCAEVLRSMFGSVGAGLIGLCLLVVSLMFVTQLSLSGLARVFASRAHKLQAWLRHRWLVHQLYRERLMEERQRILEAQHPDVDTQAKLQAELAMRPIGAPVYAFESNLDREVESKLSARLGRMFGPARQDAPAAQAAGASSAPAPASAQAPVAPGEPEAQPSAEAPAPTITKRGKKATTAPNPALDGEGDAWTLGAPPVATHDGPSQVTGADPSEAGLIDDARSHTMNVDDEDVVQVDLAAERGPVTPVGDDEGDFGPRIVESDAKAQARKIKELLAQQDGEGVLFKPQKRGGFELPPLAYLNYEGGDEQGVDADTLRDMATQIEKTLADFKVEGQIKDICPGPVITVFEFSPAAGVKISKIANLADDLAMALSALSVRIVAPIPGKGVVGIEVPNPSREMVYMKEVLADDQFQNTKMELPMGLGKDTAGSIVVTDLAKMPHLLVAGATGAGKSVAVNTMITSLLYRNSPDDVRLIMVDPKMLEFSIYADIPHLLLPVVTDPKQATVALNWAVQEMERRYHALAEMGVRNIKGYNQKVEQLTRQAEQDMAAEIEDSASIRALGIDAEGNPEHRRLPYIVVIIDEFADLMMTASKDVETAVARLAQKARASGIHLILATQRPSTDVITGLIKANFPTRVALRVTSKTDSRVILDSNGAENLLGNGDMLFVPPGTSHVKRVHGAYVSEHEIDKIVAFLRTQGKPQYDNTILVEEPGEEIEDVRDEERDELYIQAVRLVVESKQASISMIQRKLRVGYNRAARMVEMMEKDGIVSAADACKPRQVIVDSSPF